MADLLLSILAGSLPQGSCYTTEQERLVAFSNAMKALLPNGRSFYNFGPSKPVAEFQNYPWLYTDGRWYTYNGKWISPNNTDPDERRIYVGTNDAAGLWSYDGGDGSDPATTTPSGWVGAMWEVDTAMSAKFLAGAGTFAGGGVVSVNGTGGSDTHAITQAELPNVDLQVPIKIGQTDPQDPGNTFLANPNASLSPYTLQVPLGGSGTAMPTVPPYYGVYFVKRTGRQYYLIP